MRKKVSATKKKLDDLSQPPKPVTPYAQPFEYHEGSSIPLTKQEAKLRRESIETEFVKRVCTLSDDEFLLKYKHFRASKAQAAARDKLSSLDVFVISGFLFEDEMKKRGLTFPVPAIRKPS